MTRQLRTVIIGVVVCVVLAVAAFGIRVPYVVEGPGPTFNTLASAYGKQIITVDGLTTQATTGNLNMTTVSVGTGDTTVIGAIRGWLAKDRAVVPHDSVYPPGQSVQQVNQQDAQQFTESQDAATAAAACEMQYPKGFGVTSVPAGSPSAGQLRPGDAFVSVDGTPTTSIGALTAVLKQHRAGDVVTVEVQRFINTTSLNRQPATAHVTLRAPTDGGTTPQLGVLTTTGCLIPFTVSISLAQIGGPSAGMMFALGIIDKIGPADSTGQRVNLTRGRFIAGTGTIDAAGDVGAIGGIQLKMIAARRAGATVFLAPSANCSDVIGNIPKGLDVIQVSSLRQAVAQLGLLADGKAVQHC